MDYIQRLPFIIGASVCILTGVISYNTGSDKQEIYIRMALSLVGFYFIGVLIRSAVNSINKEIEDKLNKEKEEQEKKENEEFEARMAMQQAQGDGVPKPTVIDYRIDDEGEDFTPLTVNDIINTNN